MFGCSLSWRAVTYLYHGKSIIVHLKAYNVVYNFVEQYFQLMIVPCNHHLHTDVSNQVHRRSRATTTTSMVNEVETLYVRGERHILPCCAEVATVHSSWVSDMHNNVQARHMGSLTFKHMKQKVVDKETANLFFISSEQLSTGHLTYRLRLYLKTVRSAVNVVLQAGELSVVCYKHQDLYLIKLSRLWNVLEPNREIIKETWDSM